MYKNKRKIFLDTNIILSAINPHSTSHLLKFITDDFIFYYSDIVKKEVIKKISESKKSRSNKKYMNLVVEQFIKDIQLLIIIEKPLKQSINQSNDDFIMQIAQYSNCDSICTYNHKHFIHSDLPLSLPNTLLRKSSLSSFKRLDITFNLQKDMSNEWSTFISFNLNGFIADLILLEDDNKNKIVLKQNGSIELIKNNSLIKRSKTILKSNILIKLLITKNKTNMQIYNLEESFKPLIDSKTSFRTLFPVSILNLNTKNNGKFHGYVQELSMFPSYIATQKDFKKILYYNTLEYRWGSLTI